MLLFNCLSYLVIFLVVLSISFVQGAVSESEANKLGITLTPFGAVMKGNRANTIPQWTGGITASPGEYGGPGRYHPDPFSKDVPLFVITAENMDKYASHLSEGHKALLKSYPDTFRLPVYQTRRSHSAPEWVYKNTKANATTAKLVNGGNGVKGAYGGIPFPIPKNGLEVIWNHTLRWRSEYSVRRTGEATVQRNGDYTIVNSHVEILFNYYTASSYKQLDNIFAYFMTYVKSPARLAGTALLVHETMNQSSNNGGQPRLAWGYNSGQRRVRRIPNFAFDTPVTEAEGLYTADDVDLYNGSPERYKWKLKGRKEIYVPYNNYQLGSNSLKYKNVLHVGHLNPEYARYELHRVWLLEASLKEGLRHIYSKRTFYIDEDSWSILIADQYDKSGELWRVSSSYSKNYYELPSTLPVLDVYHDLLARKYHVVGLDNEEGATVDFSRTPPNARYFKPAALRRRGHR